MDIKWYDPCGEPFGLVRVLKSFITFNPGTREGSKNLCNQDVCHRICFSRKECNHLIAQQQGNSKGHPWNSRAFHELLHSRYKLFPRIHSATRKFCDLGSVKKAGGKSICSIYKEVNEEEKYEVRRYSKLLIKVVSLGSEIIGIQKFHYTFFCFLNFL